jgi:dynein heavy chain
MCAKNNLHLLMVGPTGTGKTAIVTQKLMNGMPSNFIPVVLNFSARTTAGQTQDFVNSKLTKRRKGVFGPPIGSRISLFIDDLNMPAAESTGAQPPIELIRQWMDYGGWYEKQQVGRFNEIVDLAIIACMGPPGGGRQATAPRLLRHFISISVIDLDHHSIKTILGTILDGFLDQNKLPDFKSLTIPMIDASISIYDTIRVDLLPTPTKSHYTYNMRDLSKVFRGMLSADPKNLHSDTDFIRLWCHESLRVFQDRLVDATDREWFLNLLRTNMEQHLQIPWSDVVLQEPLIYGDFLIPGADPKSYQEIKDMKRLHKIVEEYLDDYNSSTTTPMKLIMFIDAVEHLSRICRIIRQGNALLLGVGGSGRQSLARLAAFMEEYEIFLIEMSKNYGIHEWREDLKRILMQAGVDGKNLAFILSDTQIVSDACLEDVNNILNTGDVPNLFKPDDLDRISVAMKAIAQEEGAVNATKENLFALFLQRVRKHLRMIICMSPMSESFRNRLRMFPALVNCSTIDWFNTWPEEALRSVAASAVAGMYFFVF